ncbi:HAMP domain-containing histidine kinase [Phormidium sp. CLA17]|nr:HAMP domain-containing histidine kinase [Leptolyngbya sp. Cla-17]
MSSLGQLVAGIAHEINNPVNFIHGNIIHANQYAQELLNLLQLYQSHMPHPPTAIEDLVEAIDMDFVSEDFPKLLESMQVGTERIREIVQSLRIFSRLDEAGVKGVDIHEGIDSTLMILQSRLKSKSTQREIQVVKKYGSLPTVECYAGQLNQVFMNLLSNAIDALEERLEDNRHEAFGDRSVELRSDERGYGLKENNLLPTPDSHLPTIYIHTELANDHHIKIRIADNGAGISKAVQSRIFDPFFTTKSVGKGTGMGLAISYQIVTEQHNGRLNCTSTPGQGTEFVIEIPIQQAEYLN